MARLIRLLLTGLSFLPLCVLGRSLSAIETCASNGLAFFTGVDYEGECQSIPFDALDNTHRASCVDINSSMPIYSLLKSSSLPCCLLYDHSLTSLDLIASPSRQPCPNRNSPFYPQRPNLMSQRVFVQGIPDLCRFGWEGNTINSVVCPDAVTCLALQKDDTTVTYDVLVEKLIENPYTGQHTRKNVKEKREISLRGYWLDLQKARGHERAI
ncbi:hypothetical protein QBC36DRAFT_374650 [Triangularia setosa]|uniref:Uncharacterized protein n=1 Tax=Triangularia setosa TaxID=2587417 RepID=A0AAN6WIC8_9PEZI|nr:hypothetical protein QBC36DRAFT_374650 [Podospora setosa]